jgi:hypothetical protein
VRLPGLPRQCELRCWTVADLARAAGVAWATAAAAHGGGDISKLTAKKILAALEASPASATAVELLQPGAGAADRIEGRVA